jgi:hypothetical protein
MLGTNRPETFSNQQQKIPKVHDGEVSMLIETDASGNPLYIGRAMVGTPSTAAKWQISFQTYDASDSLTSKKWPLNDDGIASNDYLFVYDDRASYTYET